jgi:TonB-linked SusC/RagA family outer membrane protein
MRIAKSKEYSGIIVEDLVASRATAKQNTPRMLLRRTRYIFLSLPFILLISTGLSGQIVSGTVYDTDGFPLTGATILQVGTSNGTQTNLEGQFSLEVEGDDPVLRISYLGYLTQDVAVNDRENLDIQLAEDSETLEEVVVIGYGTQTRDNVSGAVSSLSSEAIEGRPVASFQSALQGQVAGLQITSNSGAPGGAANVRIRGTGSITGGSSPLYVVDGVIIQTGVGIAGDPFATINPNDIASVTVLKDASAAAIYGARAANGVIIITTKRGRSGTPKITLNTYVGSQSVTNTLDLLNAEQYRGVRNTVTENSGESPITNLDPANDLPFDTDWQDAVFQSGVIQNYELSASGGSDNLSYYASLGHFDEEGTIIGTGLERTTLRINTDTRLGRFKFGNSLTVSRSETDLEYVGLGNTILGWTLLNPPTVPIYNEDNIGGFAGSTNADGDPRILNPVAAQTLIERGGTANRILGSVFTEYELLEGLNYRANLGVDQSSFRNRTFAPFFDLGTGEAVVSLEEGAEVSENLGENFSLLFENTLNFRRLIGDHSIDLLGGYTIQNTEVSGINLRVVGQNISPQLPVVNGSAILPSPPRGFSEQVRTVSYIGRLMYDYDDRYLATFNFRRDGSSIFTEENYFDNFYSGSLGWVVNNEAFLADGPFSTLKLRASYGFLGNDQINAGATLALLNSNARYILGEGQGIAPSLAPGGLVANPNLVWEKQSQLNLGVDMGLLDNKLAFSFDYFVKTSDDLLLSFPLPSATGFENIFLNAAEVENSGVEATASYRNRIGELGYSLNANLTLLDNEVLALTEGLESIDRNATNEFTARNRIEVGQSLFAFYGYKTDGIYQSEEEIAAGPTPLGGTAPGDLRFVDVNEDGVINEDDRTFIGDANQDVQYGFGLQLNYRAFDFSVQFQGVSGNQIWNDTKYLTQAYFRVSNLSTDVLDAWTPTNPSTTQPRAVSPNIANNDVGSDFFVEDGAYLRLKNLQLGYTLGSGAIDRLGVLSSARIYFAAQNLLTFTDYSGYDPEVGGSGGFGFDNVGYPQSRRVTVGLTLGF